MGGTSAELPAAGPRPAGSVRQRAAKGCAFGITPRRELAWRRSRAEDVPVVPAIHEEVGAVPIGPLLLLAGRRRRNDFGAGAK